MKERQLNIQIDREDVENRRERERDERERDE